jgi:hypothetical protein
MKSKNAPEKVEMSEAENRVEVTPTTDVKTDTKVEVKADSTKVDAKTTVTPVVAPAKTEDKPKEAPKAEDKPKEAPKVEEYKNKNGELRTKDNCFLRCGPGTKCTPLGCIFVNSCNNSCKDTETCRNGKCLVKDECHNRCAEGTKCIQLKCEVWEEKENSKKSFLEIKATPTTTPAPTTTTTTNAPTTTTTTTTDHSKDVCDNQCLDETWCFKDKCRREHKSKNRTEGPVDSCGNSCGKTTLCDSSDNYCYPRRLNSGESKRVSKTKGPLGITCDDENDCGSGKCVWGWCRGRGFRAETDDVDDKATECTIRKNCTTLYPQKDGTPRGQDKDWVCHAGKCYWADSMKPGENKE